MSKILVEEDLNPYTDTKVISTAETLKCSKQDVDEIDIPSTTLYRRLRRVELLHNRLKACDFLGKFPYVTYVNLANNQISQTKSLDSLSQIVTLNLSHNLIDKTVFISQLETLKALILNNNNLSSVLKLNMPKLDTLILSHNSIKSLDLTALPSLTKVSLAHNKLTEFPNISTNTRLKTVALQHNEIVQIPEGHLSESNAKLFNLHLQFNKIQKFKSLKALYNSKVERLELYGNSVLDKEDSTNKLLILLPNLMKLDNKLVREKKMSIKPSEQSEEETAEAAAEGEETAESVETAEREDDDETPASLNTRSSEEITIPNPFEEETALKKSSVRMKSGKKATSARGIKPWDAEKPSKPKRDKRKMDSGVIELRDLVKDKKRKQNTQTDKDLQVSNFFGEPQDVGLGTSSWS